jgi:predicted nucleic acid-binding protein
MLIIYVIERHPKFAPAVEAWLIANPCDLVSNELGRMECLIVPTRSNDTALIADFEDYFQNRVAELVPLTRAVFDRAVQIRAATKIKTPDALHLASAIESGCDLLLTNEPGLTSCPGIRVVLI